MAKKAWGGRFAESNDKLFEKMNCSLPFDIRLFRQDILLNKVYSTELERQGLLTGEELDSILSGLDQVEEEIAEKGLTAFGEGVEDIHMGVEELLTAKIGDAAKKMHSGKSRNDQVATDVRKYMLDKVEEVMGILNRLLETILKLAKEHSEVAMPGFTHLRQAQPVLFSHYMMSFFFALERDYRRMADSIARISIMPLGSAALAGSALALDRENLREGLGFAKVTENSMDGVLSRDFALEFLSNVSILSLTLSRLAEDFIIFSSEQFGFFTLSDKVTTGSSIMPNKKNPDSLELTRGKTGRIIGNFVSLFTVIKSIPSTYNKDMQEDKEPLFDSMENIIDVLEVTIILLDSLQVNREVMESSIDSLSFATELADYLASQELPFRDAHHVVGKIVLDCVNNKKSLTALKESELVEYHDKFKGIGDEWGTMDKFLAKREIYGGTGRESLKRQFEVAEKMLAT